MSTANPAAADAFREALRSFVLTSPPYPPPPYSELDPAPAVRAPSVVPGVAPVSTARPSFFDYGVVTVPTRTFDFGAAAAAIARSSTSTSGVSTAPTRSPMFDAPQAPFVWGSARASNAQAPAFVFGASTKAAQGQKRKLSDCYTCQQEPACAVFAVFVPPAPSPSSSTFDFGAAPAPSARAIALGAPTFGTSMADEFNPLAPSQNRPRLPEETRNPFLDELREDVSVVKFQTLVRQEREVVVGRIKVPTPGDSHAFILRRYDTGAISLTSMFQAAFPGAAVNAKRSELAWVRSNFDTRGMNGGRETPEHVRLAGQWVSPDLANALAPAYNLRDLITAITRAHPEPDVVYPTGSPFRAAADAIRAGGPVLSLSTPSSAEPAANPSPVHAEAANDHHPITISIEVTTTVTDVAEAAAGGEAGRKIVWCAAMFGLGVGAAASMPQIVSQISAFASQFF